MRNILMGLAFMAAVGAILFVLALVFHWFGPVGVLVLPGLAFAYVTGAFINGMLDR